MRLPCCDELLRADKLYVRERTVLREVRSSRCFSGSGLTLQQNSVKLHLPIETNIEGTVEEVDNPSESGPIVEQPTTQKHIELFLVDSKLWFDLPQGSNEIFSLDLEIFLND